MKGLWFFYAMTAMSLLAISDFSLGHMNKNLRRPISTFTLNFFSYLFMGTAGLILLILGYYDYFPKKQSDIVKKDITAIRNTKSYVLILIAFVAICYLLGNKFLWKTYTTAPSIGVAEGVYSVNSVVVLLLTHFVFGVPVSFVNVAGILLSIVGVLLLSGKIRI